MSATVQFIQYSPDQLKSEINAGVKIILEDFLKNINSQKRKRKLLRRREKEKLVKVILSIVRIAIVLIYLIEPSLLLQNNHSVIITFIFQVIMLLIKK